MNTSRAKTPIPSLVFPQKDTRELVTLSANKFDRLISTLFHDTNEMVFFFFSFFFLLSFYEGLFFFFVRSLVLYVCVNMVKGVFVSNLGI